MKQRLNQPPPPRSVLSNTVAGALGTGWTILVTLLLTPVLIRRLGAQEYGVWVLLTVLLVQGRGLASLLDLGLQQSLIQRLASAPDQGVARRRLGAGFRALTVSGLVTGAVVVTSARPLVDLFRVAPAFHGAAVTGLRVIGLQLAVDLPLLAFGSALEGARRYEVRRLLDALRATVFAGLTLVVVGSHRSVAAIAVCSLAATAAYGVGIVAASRRTGLWPEAGGRAREEVAAALPLVALRLAGVGYRQLDKVVLGAVVGTVATAGFDVAEKANLMALTVLGVATSALIPAGARALDGPGGGSHLGLRATRWSALLAAPVAGMTFALAAPLSVVIAGSQLSGVAAAIRWLAPTTLVACVYAAAFEMAIGAGAARRLAPLSLAGLAVNAAATIALVPAYGLPGSAAASLIATAAVAPWVIGITADALGLRARDLLHAVAAPLGAAIVAAAGAWWGARSAAGAGAGALARGGAVGVLVWAAAAAMLARRAGPVAADA